MKERPSSGTSPKLPRSICIVIATMQSPLVGRTAICPVMQGQMKSQLQVSKYWPLMFQVGVVMLMNLPQSVGELDVRAPRILNECNCDVKGWNLRVRSIQLDALRFELLAERLEVLHLETNVIEHAPARADDRRRRVSK